VRGVVLLALPRVRAHGAGLLTQGGQAAILPWPDDSVHVVFLHTPHCICMWSDRHFPPTAPLADPELSDPGTKMTPESSAHNVGFRCARPAADPDAAHWSTVGAAAQPTPPQPAPHEQPAPPSTVPAEPRKGRRRKPNLNELGL
jgi:hypothetical protein